MKTRVKKDTCIGCGACTVIADKIFTIGDDGLAETTEPYVVEENEKDARKVKEVEEQEFDNVVDAAESCPVGAIEVIED
jgi:ferredoxin